MDIDDIIVMVRNKIQAIDETRLVYELKKNQFRYLTRSVDLVKIIIALDQCGLPITSYTVSALTGSTCASVLLRLHALGDKHLLVLKRREQALYEWSLSPLLLNVSDNLLRYET